MTDKFLVVKWDWLEEALSDKELHDFYYLLTAATAEKPEYKYYVVNKDEPYAEKVKEVIEKGENVKYTGATVGITKDELLSRLKELTGGVGSDTEAVHAEADELLLNYINDPEIEKVFEEVPKWYM